MRTMHIPGVDIPVSRLALGFWRLGRNPGVDTAALLKAALDSGITMFDHADVYARGECERLFGDVTAWSPRQREQYILQTKCGIKPLPGGTVYDSSRDHILASVDASLKRLRTEYVDVLLIHRPDILMEPEEMAAAFQMLRDAGKARHFGVSNMRPLQMERICRCWKQGLVVNQLQFSLGHAGLVATDTAANMMHEQSIDRASDVLDYCQLHGITVQAWSPLQHTGKGFIPDNPELPELNRALENVAAAHGTHKTAIALAWIMRHPAGIQPILGTTSPVHLREACDAVTIDLAREEWYALYRAAGYVTP